MLPEAKDGEEAPWSGQTHVLSSSKKNRAQTCFHHLCIPVLPCSQAGQKDLRFRNWSIEENSSTEGPEDCSWDLQGNSDFWILS